MKIVLYLFSAFVLASILYACEDDDKFSTSSDLRLAFSTDTINFDTVFTTIGSATKRLKVYNRNKEAINISNIALASGGSSGFRMNVDGESGNSINNVDLLGKDSLYIFVEVTVDPLNRNNPLLIADSIRLQFNGVTQYVRLEAIGQDVFLWKGRTLDKDTVLTGEKPFLIYNDLTIANNATLDIKENTTLYFHQGAKLKVNGTIKAKGTIEKPVVMRGDRTDYLFESLKIPYDRIPGQWGGIEIASSSYNNVFENVRIRNGVYGVLFHESDTTQQKANFMNTMVQNTTKEGIWAVNCKITAENSLFDNSGGYTVRLLGGSYFFLQCTLANYMSSYWVSFRQSALELTNTGNNYEGKSVTYPLGKALFVNTIVAGSTNSEMKLTSTENNKFNYRFLNCLLKIKGTDDDNFQNIVWNVDPLFKYIYSPETVKEHPNWYYYYNFQLTKESPAVNKGNRTYAVSLPFDIVGNSRRNDQAPDIGCYEFVE